MAGSLNVITPPSVEPVTLPEIKSHLRIDFADDDAMLQGMLRAARTNLERRYRHFLGNQTVVLGLDYFWQPESDQAPWQWPWPMGTWYGAWYSTSYSLATFAILELQGPVQGVVSVTYVDPGNVQRTLDPSQYVVDTSTNSGRIFPAQGTQWPPTSYLPGGVKITYNAGYASPALVPDDIKMALKMFVGHLYENREWVIQGTRVTAIEVPSGVEYLMTPYDPHGGTLVR